CAPIGIADVAAGEGALQVWIVRTRQGGEYEASTLISCSGLMADRLVKMLGLEPGFIICPFRGEYFRLAPEHNQIVNHLIYPIPDPAMPFLGVPTTRASVPFRVQRWRPASCR
ncbi:FAD-dependent oxidoreductase, partial [Escherichia sp. HC-CC]